MAALARRSAPRICVLAAILAASVVLTWAWGGLGDYPGDGGPSIADFLHGHFASFFHRQPGMGALALFLRLPFAGLAFLGSPTPVDVYRFGALPCVVSVGLLGWWLSRMAAARGAGVVAQAAIVVVCLVNPVVRTALVQGHPEELLTASLAVGAVVAANRGRDLTAAVLLGLALASKQWAVIVALPIFLLAAERRRSVVIAVAVAAALSLPLVVGSPSSFLETQVGLIHQQYLEPATESWLYPLAPSVHRHVVLDGRPVTVSVARLPRSVVGLLHPLIIALAAAMAVALWRRMRGRPSHDQVFALAALILLVRCTLDTETMPYYHAALLFTLLAWDAAGAGRIPVRGLVGAAIAYLLVDQVGPAVSPGVASACYGVVTVVAAGLLAAVLVWRRPTDRPAGLEAPAERSPRPTTAGRPMAARAG